METDGKNLVNVRERRQKEKNSPRSAAFEVFKKSKKSGERFKYEPSLDSVYDVVDEEEYSVRVRKRQENADWIVNDGTSDYVEDGREIFDDDFDSINENRDSKKKQESRRFKSKNPNVANPESNGKTCKDLKTFFSSSSTSKKPDSLSTVDDANLLSEALNCFPASVNKQQNSKPLVFLAGDRKLTGTFVPKNGPINPFAKEKSSSKRVPPSPAKENSPIKSRPQKQMKQSTTPVKPKCTLPVSPDYPRETSKDVKNLRDVEKTEPIDFECPLIESFDDSEERKTKIVDGTPPENDDVEMGEFSEPIKDGDEIIGDEKLEIEIPNLDDLKIDELIVTSSNDERNEGILKFYLLDVSEDVKNPGVVYLFGRIYDASKRAHFSCSVVVRNVERRVWFLPREQRIDLKTNAIISDTVEFAELYEEITKLTKRHGIPAFRVKKVNKKYSAVGSLNVQAPSETDYIEMRYSFANAALPSDLTGETFAAIFGTTSSALELFLLEQKIKGPRWVDIIDPVARNPRVTYCNFEFEVAKPSFVRPTTELSCLPLRASVLTLKTMPNAKNQHEIVAAGLWNHASFQMEKDKSNENQWQRICFITKGSDCVFPFDFKEKLKSQTISVVEVVANERALINLLLSKLQTFDPDVIIGHDLWNFELEILMQRIVVTKLPRWDRLGRLRRGVGPKTMTNKSALHDVTFGRLICDVGIMAREMIRAKDYDLSGLVLQIFNQNRDEILPENVKFMYSSSDELLRFINCTKVDCSWLLRIATKLQCLPLAGEITRIVGGVFSKTLMGGRSERTEFLLLHALENLSYIYPDKISHFKKRLQENLKEDDAGEVEIAVQSTGRKKAAYAGGLVLEPKKGLYDCLILLLDFNSLYPSIMQEFNICFTTIDLLRHKAITNGDVNALPAPPNSTVELGILPSEIKKLVEWRRNVKKLMKDANATSEQLQQYTIRQQALKITANSMYGCLGFGNSRFYAKPLAALITSKGREILTDTKELVETMGLDVIYGDTDSIMINTKRTEVDEATEIAKKVKNEVCKKYRLLELEMDGIYKKLLLLKKKKYAGLAIDRRPDGNVVFKKEIKGLDIIRRDWSSISVEAGDFVLSEILSDKGVDEILETIHKYLTHLAEEIRENKIDATKFVITKQLTKSPNEYGDKKSLPHVVVALRLNSEKGRRFKQGDVVSYVICEDGTNNSATQRAYDLSELNDSEKNLKIDVHYYLSQQIHPVVSRLCEPIDGTDAVRIAECLGLDASSYRQRLAAVSTNEDEDWTSLINPASDYSCCDSFSFVCPNPACNTICEIRSTFVGTGKDIRFSLWKCANSKCTEQPYNNWTLLCNTFQMSICQLISKYYSNWMTCDDVTCAFRTRRVNFKLENGQVKCPSCRKNVLKQEVTEKSVYVQLTFFQTIFDIENALCHLSKEERDIVAPIVEGRPNPRNSVNHAYKELNRIVQTFLRYNSYSQIDLGKLFHGLKFL